MGDGKFVVLLVHELAVGHPAESMRDLRRLLLRARGRRREDAFSRYVHVREVTSKRALRYDKGRSHVWQGHHQNLQSMLRLQQVRLPKVLQSLRIVQLWRDCLRGVQTRGTQV